MADNEDVAAALVILSRFHVPPDIQELLVYGNPRLSVKPGALKAALDTPARANAEKMLPEFKVAQKSYCRHNCWYPYNPDEPIAHVPECLNMQSIIAAAEGREVS